MEKKRKREKKDTKDEVRLSVDPWQRRYPICLAVCGRERMTDKAKSFSVPVVMKKEKEDG